MGDLIEFPRVINWEQVEHWVGVIPGTTVVLQVMARPNHPWRWFVWAAHSVVLDGLANTLEEAKTAAVKAAEKHAMVIRPI